MERKDSRPERRTQGIDRSELEFAINELAADQAALRVVLQSFLLRLFAVRAETAPAALAELRAHILESIAAIPLAPDDQYGGARWRRMVKASAERLLGEIGDTFDASIGDQPLRKASQPNRRYPSSSG